MSLTVTQRPSQTINSETADWNAVGNPILYKMQRKDFTFASVTNSGGFVRLVLDSSFGDVSASFDVNDVVYFQTDAGVYATTGTVTASSYSAPNTLVTLDTAYISSSTGFVNNDNLRPLYRVDVSVYDSSNNLLNADAFSYTPSSSGALSMDISAILRAQMVADNDADLTDNSEAYDSANVYLGFYIKYREVWTGSAESLSDDSANVFFAIFGAMQVPSQYGGNIYEYLLLSDMKIADVTISSASVLTSNASPVTIVAAPGTGYVIIPVKFFVFLDYNSAAYATNTTFRFEINGVAVSATNTSILPGTADRYTTLEPTDYDTTTDLKNQALVLETQSGNPTAGNSPLRVVCIYKIQSVA